MQTPYRATRGRAPLTALALAAGLAALTHAPAHAQSLNGQPVNVKFFFPNQTTLFNDEGTQTVTPAGAAFTEITGNATQTVTPGQITFTFNTSASFNPAVFNGFQITETGGSPVTITGVSLDPSSNLTGFDASRISFDAKDVFANFQSLSFTPSSKVTLDLSFAPAAVPEPAPALTFAVAALGLGGLMVVAARRKKASAAA